MEQEFKAQIKKRDQIIDDLNQLFRKVEQEQIIKQQQSEKYVKDVIEKNKNAFTTLKTKLGEAQ